MRNLTQPTAPRTVQFILLAAVSVCILLVFERYLARLLDDHVAAAIIAMMAAVIVVALASTFFAGRR